MVILNAGMGGFTGLNWPRAVWTVLTDWVHAVTWPTYKYSAVGALTGSQVKLKRNSNKLEEQPLGEVFCANVFGHYLLVHWISPLLSRAHATEEAGRIIWVSSVEAISDTFSSSDIQGLRSHTSYESSKRLTDILALTSELPSTQNLVKQYLPLTEGKSSRPTMYLMHPGICATSIVPLHIILQWAMIIAFYVARWVGSPWHTVTAYSGACAAVWLALSPKDQMDSLEQDGARKHKWGSATDLRGNDRVTETEVDGWGYGGVVAAAGKRRAGRRRGAKDLTSVAKAEFEELGRDVWRQMERLRIDWQERLMEV